MHTFFLLHSNQEFLIIAQNEDNTSSGTRITSLQFDMSSSILISGDQSGTVSYSMTTRQFLLHVFHALVVHNFFPSFQVRIIAFKKDSNDNILSFLHGTDLPIFHQSSYYLDTKLVSDSSILQKSLRHNNLNTLHLSIYNLAQSVILVGTLN
jgi:hypothetical protein